MGSWWMVMGTMGIFVPWVLRKVNMRRLISSRSAAGILSLLAEMNCMRASSREMAVSPSLVMMMRTGIKLWATYGRRKKSQSFWWSQGSMAMVTCSLGWVSLAGYSAAGLAGGAFLSEAWAGSAQVRASV